MKTNYISIAEQGLEDDGLEKELKSYGVGKLYQKMRDAGVSSDDVWDLDDDEIEACKFLPLEKSRYLKARAKRNNDSMKDSGMLPQFS